MARRTTLWTLPLLAVSLASPARSALSEFVCDEQTKSTPGGRPPFLCVEANGALGGSWTRGRSECAPPWSNQVPKNELECGFEGGKDGGSSGNYALYDPGPVDLLSRIDLTIDLSKLTFPPQQTSVQPFWKVHLVGVPGGAAVALTLSLQGTWTGAMAIRLDWNNSVVGGGAVQTLGFSPASLTSDGQGAGPYNLRLRVQFFRGEPGLVGPRLAVALLNAPGLPGTQREVFGSAPDLRYHELGALELPGSSLPEPGGVYRIHRMTVGRF